tara:strand:+ start:199 stop:501 length:303 start_codon:yes stop_codon:yes gene_type:complete
MTERNKDYSDIKKNGKANGNQKLVVDGNEHKYLTEADKAMEHARKSQAEEVLHEQVRMERLHVSAMALQGMLALNNQIDPDMAAERATQYADALLKAIMK